MGPSRSTAEKGHHTTQQNQNIEQPIKLAKNDLASLCASYYEVCDHGRKPDLGYKVVGQSCLSDSFCAREKVLARQIE